MYSTKLQDYIQQVSVQAQIEVSEVTLLMDTVACFIGVIGRLLEASTEPEGDLLNTTVRLLLISDGLSRVSLDEDVDGIHYLVGLGFEQLTVLIARHNATPSELDPLENELWMGLTLSLLHYLAGGHRVQALCVLRHLQAIPSQIGDPSISTTYHKFSETLRRLYSGREIVQTIENLDSWDELFQERRSPRGVLEARLQRLARKIRTRRDVLLSALGEGDEQGWLSRRGLGVESVAFWRDYLAGLSERGITTFTNEQVGDQGFDGWLQPDKDLLVVLPTGAGKTIIAELRTALALAQNKNVLWLLPTRALVRQTQQTLQEAFARNGVEVQELPTTEDFIPLFADWAEERRFVSVSTPERIDALLRAKPEAASHIGLVVVDEAQILFDRGRGVTAELVLHKIIKSAPQCNVVLMSAFWELKEMLREFLARLRKHLPLELISDRRPTRRLYGVLTNDDVREAYCPITLLYPPGPQEDAATTEKPFKIKFDRIKYGSLPKTLDLVVRVARKATEARLRTVVFVYRVKSTEIQAKRIIGRGKPSRVILPREDISRLDTELGRRSVIDETGCFGVAPHHAGLTPLEQVIVERWVHDGLVNTVCATQTLAQGVNLPFDLAIVSFTKRHNRNRREELSIQEIRNMLGRAGRAGYVSDGIALIAEPNYSDPLRTLSRSRRFFFAHLQPTNERLGLARLALDSVLADVGNVEWPFEMGGMNLTEAQSLLHFLTNIEAGSSSDTESLSAQLALFSSVQNLSDIKLNEAVAVLIKLGQNVEETLAEKGDVALHEALKHTGMPIEVLDYFLLRLRSDRTSIEQLQEPSQVAWADDVVFHALSSCSHREWYKRMREHSTWKKASLDSLRQLIVLWRSGAPVVQLEMAWQSQVEPVGLDEGVDLPSQAARINCGKFRKELPLLAQFWAALAVCYEIESGLDENVNLKQLLVKLPALIREGVPTVEQLEWLNILGGVDRVLAIQMCKRWAEFENKILSGHELRKQVKRWRERKAPLPAWLDQQSKQALEGILSI